MCVRILLQDEKQDITVQYSQLSAQTVEVVVLSAKLYLVTKTTAIRVSPNCRWGSSSGRARMLGCWMPAGQICDYDKPRKAKTQNENRDKTDKIEVFLRVRRPSLPSPSSSYITASRCQNKIICNLFVFENRCGCPATTGYSRF